MTIQATFSATHLTCFRQNRALFTDVNIAIYPKHILSVEGPNGAGKSSLLRILSGLTTPCSGSIYWQGQDIEHERETFLHAMHYLGHRNGIKLGLSVQENLTLIQHQLLITEKPAYDVILEKLNLTLYRNTLVNHLSAGQKRRVALAKLLLFPKPLWIVDEPLTSLDHDTQLFFLSALTTHLQLGGMAIITSHQPFKLDDVVISTLRLGT